MQSDYELNKDETFSETSSCDECEECEEIRNEKLRMNMILKNKEAVCFCYEYLNEEKEEKRKQKSVSLDYVQGLKIEL
jgi:hypothetical protein